MPEDQEEVISTFHEEVKDEVVVEKEQEAPPSTTTSGKIETPIHPKEDQGYRWIEINPADRNFIVEALRNMPIKSIYVGRRIESMVAKIEGKKERINLSTPL